jgi:hypothetical protein
MKIWLQLPVASLAVLHRILHDRAESDTPQWRAFQSVEPSCHKLTEHLEILRIFSEIGHPVFAWL